MLCSAIRSEKDKGKYCNGSNHPLHAIDPEQPVYIILVLRGQSEVTNHMGFRRRWPTFV